MERVVARRRGWVGSGSSSREWRTRRLERMGEALLTFFCGDADLIVVVDM